MTDFAREAAETIMKGIGRRDFVRAVTVVGTGAGVAALATACGSGDSGSAPSSPVVGAAEGFTILQPDQGDLTGDHYLQSLPDQVLWGYVPNVHAAPAIQMRSGETITIDAVSHEGILEDQGRNPVEYFGAQGVAEGDVLQDAVAIAADYNRTPRDFDTDGPHVVTGPVFIEGAQPGDVLKIETLQATPRVPYGVVSSRHGKGALSRTADGGASAGLSLIHI